MTRKLIGLIYSPKGERKDDNGKTYSNVYDTGSDLQQHILSLEKSLGGHYVPKDREDPTHNPAHYHNDYLTNMKNGSAVRMSTHSEHNRPHHQRVSITVHKDDSNSIDNLASQFSDKIAHLKTTPHQSNNYVTHEFAPIGKTNDGDIHHFHDQMIPHVRVLDAGTPEVIETKKGKSYRNAEEVDGRKIAGTHKNHLSHSSTVHKIADAVSEAHGLSNDKVAKNVLALHHSDGSSTLHVRDVGDTGGDFQPSLQSSVDTIRSNLGATGVKDSDGYEKTTSGLLLKHTKPSNESDGHLIHVKRPAIKKDDIKYKY